MKVTPGIYLDGKAMAHALLMLFMATVFVGLPWIVGIIGIVRWLEQRLWL